MLDLYKAIREKNTAKAIALIETGSDINAPDRQGHFPLYLACRSKLWKVALALIDAGVDVKTLNLGRISYYSLFSKGESETVILALIKNGLDVDTVDDYGRSILYLACAHNLELVALVLIAMGADVNAAPRNIYLPLFKALRHCQGDVISLLVMKSRPSPFNFTRSQRKTLRKNITAKRLASAVYRYRVELSCFPEFGALVRSLNRSSEAAARPPTHH